MSGAAKANGGSAVAAVTSTNAAGAGLRGDRDRSYRHVFKGMVLVNTLLDYDSNRFPSREAAVKFAQKLLDLGQVESIVGSPSFEDGMALYRWCDESVVREAKKIAHTTTAHIPKRRLIELLDLQHPESGSGEPNSVEKAREAIHSSIEKSTASANKRELNNNNDQTPTRGSTRPSPGSSGGRNTNSVTSTRGRRSSITRQPREGAKTTRPSIRSSSIEPPKSTRSASSDRVPQRRQRSTSSTQKPNLNNNNSMTKPALSSVRSRINTGRGAPGLRHAGSTSALSTASHSRGSSLNVSGKGGGGTESEKKEQSTHDTTAASSTPTPRARGTPDLVRCPDMSVRARPTDTCRTTEPKRPRIDTSIEHHVNSVLEGQEAASLAVPENYDGFESDVFVSPAVTPSIDAQVTLNSQPNGLDTATLTCTSDSSLSGVTGDLAKLTAENSGFSDNEKQLLSQMRRMQEEHKVTVTQYEEQILQLMSQISELRVKADRNEVKPAKTASLTPGTTQQVPEPSETHDVPKPPEITPGVIPEPPPSPPPGSVPIPPPPPPAGALFAAKPQMTLLPSKAAVIPRVKMRPLFWSRIILGQHCCDEDISTFWHMAQEPNFDVEEFETLFGRDASTEPAKIKSLHETISSKIEKVQQDQHAKLLDENRSRTVGIKLRSLHCDMNDIRQAVYKLKFNKLDIDSLHGLYEVRGTDEELAKITSYVHNHPGVSLDQPEQFLLELSGMPQFSERIECLTFRKSFNETLFNIDQQLDMVEQACKTIKRSKAIGSIMELVLAFGNYMNGGTQRGQADGFDLEVLSKLKDVKSMDNSTNLLRHLVRVQAMEEPDSGKHEAEYRLPDSAVFAQAGTTTFKEVTAELNKLKAQLKLHSRKADIVCLHSDVGDLQPFKHQMEDFFETADNMLKVQFEKLDSTSETFEQLLGYLTVKDTSTTPESFFSLWSAFLDDYKALWKVEQKNIAKRMFNTVQDQKRLRQAMRRQSVVEDSGKTGSLKEKFTNIRRRSSMATDAQTPGKLFRSQSVCAVDNAGVDQPDVHSATEPRRRRRQVQSMVSAASTTSLHIAEASSEATPVRSRERNALVRSRSTATSSSFSPTVSETMGERMSRIRNSADIHEMKRQSSNDSALTHTPRSARSMQRLDVKSVGEAPSSNESIKQQMDRRRRERQSTASDSSMTSADLKASISRHLPSKRSSVDLNSLKQKFNGASESTPSTPGLHFPLSRRASLSNVDTIHNGPSPDSNEGLDSPTLSRQRRREAWRGSRSSLVDNNDTPSSTGWRESTSNLADMNKISTTRRVPKERVPISWRSPKASSSSESETPTPTMAAAPSRQNTSESLRKKSTTREPITWRGSHSNLHDSKTASWRGSHQNLSINNAHTSSPVDNARMRRNEAWRGSHSNLASTDSPKDAINSPNLHRTRSRPSVNGVHDTSTPSLKRAKHVSAGDSASNSPTLRRSRSRQSVNDDSPEPGRLSRASSRTQLIHDSSDGPGRRRYSTSSTAGSSGKAHQQNTGYSSTVSSVVKSNSKLTANETDALSEKDYKERLRKLSRSKQSLDK